MQNIQWVLSRVNWSTLLDLAAVTLIFYWFLAVVQGTRAVQLVRGIIILWLASALLSTLFQLTTLTWLIRNSGLALLVAIPIVFQPELRRALEQLGRTGTWFNRDLFGGRAAVETMIDEVAAACAFLARQKHGALIILERQTQLQDYADKGVALDADVSHQLLRNIFYPNSPLHDGAVIIRNGRIVAAGAVLPLSDNVLGTPQYGTRHRAALGISEYSDAVAVVVSEERGTISIAANGRLISISSPDKLRKTLLDLFRVTTNPKRPATATPKKSDEAVTARE
ncbi:MAG: TIGR00159 family protein [Chloroflexi bacterium]|nr:TIGR00159 family protein [Chloroflexota bacterium]